MSWWAWVLIGFGVLCASWMLLVLLAARLPEGSLKELAGFLPDCVTTARRLRGDLRVPARAKFAIGFALLWVLSPIDLIPEFLPVIGPSTTSWSSPSPFVTGSASTTIAPTRSLAGQRVNHRARARTGSR